MGIETTVKISRDKAIERISFIVYNTIKNNYQSELKEAFSNESTDIDIVDTYLIFLKEYIFKLTFRGMDFYHVYKDIGTGDVDMVDINDLTNKLPDKDLEDLMDYTGVRFSMFENYMID